MMRRLAILMAISLSLGQLSCSTSGSNSADDELANLDEVVSDSGDTGDQADSSGEVAAIEEKPAEDQIEEELDDADVQETAEEKAAEEPPQEQAANDQVDEEFDKLEEPQEQPQEPVAPPEELVAEAPPAAEPVSQDLAEISDIKYLANKNGGTVVIETSAPVAYQVRSNSDTNQFVVEISGARLPDRLKRPYILKEFDASFAAINSYQNPGATTARVVIQLKSGDSGQPVIQQEGNTLVVIPATPTGVADAETDSDPEKAAQDAADADQSIDVKAAKHDEEALGARSLSDFMAGSEKFYGTPISVEVTDQDIREVLNFVASESGLNLILSDDVQGRVTMKLRNIPWDQVLVTIMKSRKLGYIRQGTVVRISSLSALQEEADASRKIIEMQKVLSPTRVKVIPVSYAQVEALSKQIQPFLTKGRGEISVDPRTSSLLITDTEEALERVGRLVKELDIPPAQVMIEGKVVEAVDNFAESLGLNWALTGVPIVIGKGKGLNGTDLTLNSSLALTNLASKSAGAGASPFSLAMRVGRFDIIGDVNAALNLAETESMVKILSSPRVVTMNKEKANISQKGQVITVNFLVDQTGKTSRTPVRTDFSLELGVTPQVTAEGSVIMEVDVKREFPGAIVDADSGARPINSRQAKTKILVNDGQTAVIGGIYSSDQTTAETGTPWLRHIPVLGWLFKSRVRTSDRNELLIFLTPKILNIKDQAIDG